MINKKIFSILEEIEKTKIVNKTIKIKNLYLKKKEVNDQLKTLMNYNKEYIDKKYQKMKHRFPFYQWKSYNSFIAILTAIIEENKNILLKNQKDIEKILEKWSKNQVKLKKWQYLDALNKKNILKTKKIQEEILNDNQVQLKILNRDYYYNVEDY